MLRLFLTLPIVLASCLKDETVSGYADPDAVYTLEELNGTPFDAPATISFPTAGSVRGKGPCNSYSASQSAPYPWLDLGPFAVTRALCSESPSEKLFFAALVEMTQIEAFAGVIILRSEAGGEMVFRAR